MCVCEKKRREKREERREKREERREKREERREKREEREREREREREKREMYFFIVGTSLNWARLQKVTLAVIKCGRALKVWKYKVLGELRALYKASQSFTMGLKIRNGYR